MDRETAVLEISTPRKGILQLTLNRPTVLNALNRALMEALFKAIQSARDDNTVRAVLILSNGRAFCAGADIRELAALNGQTGLAFAEYGQSVFRALENLGKPSLAAVQGAAMGGGMELAMAATLRIASEEAVFAQPEVRLGVIPGFGGTQRLTRLVGRGRAMAWCLSGQKIRAREAESAGLVNEVVAASDLAGRALAILSELVLLPPVALRSVVTVICQGHDLTLEDGLALEAAHFALCCATKDKQEGVTAFVEKRVATFCGE